VAISRLLRSLRSLAMTFFFDFWLKILMLATPKFPRIRRIRRPRFLAKILRAFHKLSFELEIGEQILNFIKVDR